MMNDFIKMTLREQNTSQGIERIIETDPSIRECDQEFEKLIRYFRDELKRIGRRDMIPMLLDMADLYQSSRVLMLEIIVEAFDHKDNAHELVQMMKEQNWISEDEYRKLNLLIELMPTMCKDENLK